MDAALKVSFLVTSLVLMTLGMRLLWLWRRTRQIEELSIGIAYGPGTVGLFILVACAPAARAGNDVFGIWLVGQLLIYVSQAALVLGTWRIFRPAWPIPAMLGIALAVTSAAHAIFDGQIQLWQRVDFAMLLSTATGLYAFGWVGIESLLYSRQLARRRVLGLAETLSVWRFRMWGVAAFCAAAVSALSVLSSALYGAGLSRVPWIFLVSQILLIVASTTTWCSFFPPVWLKARASQSDHTPALEAA